MFTNDHKCKEITPIVFLQAEAHLPPLKLHRGLLTVRGLINLNYKEKGRNVTGVINYNSFDVENSYAMSSFMIRALLWCKVFEINIKRVGNNKIIIPPWVKNAQRIMGYDESCIYNNETFLEYLCEQCGSYKYCYTDGSTGIGNYVSVGSAMYFSHLKIECCYRLDPNHTVLFSKLFAIKQVLHYIKL